MKKTIKAVIAMVLVLSLGFMMLSTTAFAAAAASDVAAPQAAGIGDFFKSIFKKISDSVKSFFSKIFPSKDPTPPTQDPDLPNNPSADDGKIVIDNSQDKGENIGSDAIYAGGIW